MDQCDEVNGVDVKPGKRQLIIVLENASLEQINIRGGKNPKYTLLNSDDHRTYIKKNSRIVSECRPDIVHHCLLTILDSPLNKAGLIKVYVRTVKNVLIEIDPHTRIPRTFKRFSGLMTQLLHKLSIRSLESSKKLLKVIKNPISDHLPTNCYKIAFSGNSKLVDLNQYSKKIPDNVPIAVFIGAHAHGEDNWADDIVQEKISISNYSLSAAVVCSKVTNAFEQTWNIL